MHCSEEPQILTWGKKKSPRSKEFDKIQNITVPELESLDSYQILIYITVNQNQSIEINDHKL